MPATNMDGDLSFRYTGHGVVVYPPGATLGPRINPDPEWVLIEAGDVKWRCDGVEYAAPAGTLILVPPGVRDEFVWDQRRPTRHSWVHFRIGGSSTALGPAEQWPRVRALPEADVARPLLQHLVSLLSLPTAQRPPDSALQGVGWHLLWAFVTGHLGTTYGLPEALPPPIERLFATVAAQWDEPPLRQFTLAEMAAIACVSEVHLCRLFQRTFGMRPGEVFRLNRLRRAAQLLAHSDLQVQEIAQLTGFASPFHFSRAFRDAFDLAPTDFRERVRRGEHPGLPPGPNIQPPHPQ